LAALSGDEDAAWAALWTGLATGLVVLVAGVAGGGAYFSRRGGRLMEFAESTIPVGLSRPAGGWPG
jgi:ABC-2 type transport system permease protein